MKLGSLFDGIGGWQIAAIHAGVNPVTVFQTIPVDGIIVVSSPQELVEMIVSKAVRMAGIMNIPVLGMIENIFGSADYEVTQVLVSGSDVPTTFSESELYEMIQSGEFYLADSTGKEISVSGNVQLAIESDTTGLAKAEAEYNAKTLKIGIDDETGVDAYGDLTIGKEGNTEKTYFMTNATTNTIVGNMAMYDGWYHTDRKSVV